MNRLNIFNSIHKGLRAMLYDMALTIQHTDFSKREEGTATLRKMKQVLGLYLEHGSLEDHVLFPAVAPAGPEVIAMLESDHEKDEQLTNDLLLQIRRWREAANDAERAAIGYLIHLNFQDFVAFNIHHMSTEERNINPLLWEQFTDDGLRELQTLVRINVKPESEIFMTRWMLKGLSDAELQSWFTKVRETSPEAVWNGLWLIAIDELGFEKISALTSHERVHVVI